MLVAGIGRPLLGDLSYGRLACLGLSRSKQK